MHRGGTNTHSLLADGLSHGSKGRPSSDKAPTRLDFLEHWLYALQDPQRRPVGQLSPVYQSQMNLYDTSRCTIACSMSATMAEQSRSWPRSIATEVQQDKRQTYSGTSVMATSCDGSREM